MNQRNMNKSYIRLGDENLNIDEFIAKVRNYDVELTRGEVLSVVELAQQINPADVPQIIDTVQKTYHLHMTF